MKTVQISLNSIDKVKSFVNEITKYDNDFDLVSRSSGRLHHQIIELWYIKSCLITRQLFCCPITLRMTRKPLPLSQSPSASAHLSSLPDSALILQSDPHSA